MPVLGWWHTYKHLCNILWRSFEHVCTKQVFEAIFPGVNYRRENSSFSQTLVYFMYLMNAWKINKQHVVGLFNAMKRDNANKKCMTHGEAKASQCEANHAQSPAYMGLRSLIDLMEYFLPIVMSHIMASYPLLLLKFAQYMRRASILTANTMCLYKTYRSDCVHNCHFCYTHTFTCIYNPKHQFS